MGAIIEGVVDLVSDVADAFVDAAESIWDAVTDLFDGGGGYSLSTDANSTEKSIITSDELSAIHDDIRNKSTKAEREIMDMLTEHTDSLISNVEEINGLNCGGKILNININGIKEKVKLLEKDVVGYVGDKIVGETVLTNPAFSAITKEYDDKIRNKKLNEFIDNKMHDAVLSLCDMIKSTVNAQQNLIESEINARLSEIDKNINDEKKNLNDILTSKQKNEDMASKQIDQMYTHDLFVILEDLATSEN